jgi:phosphoglycerol transferase
MQKKIIDFLYPVFFCANKILLAKDLFFNARLNIANPIINYLSNNRIFPYLIQAVIALAIFIFGFGPLRFVSGWPTGSSGDAMHHVMLAKAIIEQGWYWNIERLSAPFNLPLIIFPVGGLLDTILFKLFAILTDNPFTLITWFFATTFVLSTISASYVLNDLGLKTWTSAAFALTFAFAPIPFGRSVEHLMLVTYLVPFAIGFSVHLMSGSFVSLSSSRKAVYLVAAFALGLNYVYTAFFACFFVAVAILVLLFQPPLRASARHGVLFIAIISTGVILSLGPSFLAAKSDPDARTELYGFKSRGEADIYGLKIRHLLLPTNNSSNRFVVAARENLSNGFPLENENTLARLGIVGSLGFLIAMIAGFIRLAERQSNTCEICNRIGPLSALLVAGVFFSSIGGFGSIFNTFVSVEIRAYNRIAMFLLFIGVLTSALAFTQIIRRINFLWIMSLLVCVVIVSLMEQNDFRKLRANSIHAIKKIDEVKPSVEILESIMPPGAAIYQMPFTSYPHTPNVENMLPNEHLMGYALSRELRWNWPALSGDAIALNRKLSAMKPKLLTKALVALGFSAVWLNRSAYTDHGAAIVAELQQAGANLIDQDNSNKIALLDLRQLRNQLELSIGVSALDEERRKLLGLVTYSVGDTIFFSRIGDGMTVIGKGWSGQEEEFRWTESPRAEIRFRLVPFNGQITLLLSATALLTQSRPSQRLIVLVNGHEAAQYKFILDQPLHDMMVPIDPAWIKNDHLVQLTLAVDDNRSPKDLGISSDERTLGVLVRSITITGKR